MISLLLSFACSTAPNRTGAADPGMSRAEPAEDEREGSARRVRDGARQPAEDEEEGPQDPAAAEGLTQVAVEAPEIGGRRTAWVHAPTSGNGPYPLVLAFHGGHGNTGLEMAPRLKEAFGAPVLFAFPDGDRANENDVGWVGPGFTVPDDRKDVKFVLALIDELAKQYPVDKSKVYAVGFSNGGFMTHTLYCLANDAFAGFAVVSRPVANSTMAVCDGAAPKPMLFAMGTADDHLVPNDHQVSIDETIQWYLGKLQCKPDDKASDTLPDKGDRTTVEHTVWKDCARKVSMEYYKIEGGGHFWPGVGRPVPGRSRDLDLTAEILRFFDLTGGR